MLLGSAYLAVFRRSKWLDRGKAPPAVSAPPTAGGRLLRKWHILAAGLFSTALLVLVGLAAGVLGPATAPPRQSIVVLPFDNLSGDPNDDYLVEGITEDVTADLARVPGMLVISRDSAYAYQGKAIDVRQVGKDLGIRYVVEGSVRRLGDTLRVSAWLIATETGAQLWGDRFDQKLSDLSAGQDAIVSRIGQTLNVTLADLEIARSKRERPTNPDAFDLILRARSLTLHPMRQQQHAERKALLEQALRLDPHSVYALTQLAFEIDREQVWGSANGDDPDRAARLLAQAAAISPNNLSVLSETAHLYFTDNRYGEAVSAYQRLLHEYPNAHWAWYTMAANLVQLGRSEEAVQAILTTLRRDPLNGWNYDRYAELGWALLLLGRNEESITWVQRAQAAAPSTYPVVRAWIGLRLAAADARLGRLEEAHAALAEVNRAWPFATVRSAAPGFSSSRVLAYQIEQYQAALRLAGLRDHAEEGADFAVPADANLHQDLAGFTPTTVPGATTIQTDQLRQLLDAREPVVIDTLSFSWGRSLPNAIGLQNVGRGGATSDATQNRLRNKMQTLTKGDLTVPIIAVGWNSEHFDGRNLAVRLVALGYTNVYWYRGGREAWEVNGLREANVDVQEW